MINLLGYSTEDAPQTKLAKNNKANQASNQPARTVVRKTKPPKVWTSVEGALLKLMILGFSPIGRNVAGSIFFQSFSADLSVFLSFCLSISASFSLFY